MIELYQGDCLEVLKTLEPESINCCVTSPPYYGLRDYGVSGQLGLEKTPQEYVENMVRVFREVKRVMKNDGTLWLNLGDSYAANNGGDKLSGKNKTNKGCAGNTYRRPSIGLKPKDLIGIPWKVAFALQADGWYLRQDIIWSKPNPMPESVRDRCTKSHEYIFLLSKSAKYFYDHEAIKEPSVYPNGPNSPQSIKSPYGQGFERRAKAEENKKGLSREESTKVIHGNKVGRSDGGRACNKPDQTHRNKRDVWSIEDHNSLIEWLYDNKKDILKEYLNTTPDIWTVSTKPYKEAHFATFPPDLIEPCILAGCPEGGTVLDNFSGAGTVGKVSKENGRDFIGIELNPKYLEMSEKRIEKAQYQMSF